MTLQEAKDGIGRTVMVYNNSGKEPGYWAPFIKSTYTIDSVSIDNKMVYVRTDCKIESYKQNDLMIWEPDDIYFVNLYDINEIVNNLEKLEKNYGTPI